MDLLLSSILMWYRMHRTITRWLSAPVTSDNSMNRNEILYSRYSSQG